MYPRSSFRLSFRPILARTVVAVSFAGNILIENFIFGNRYALGRTNHEASPAADAFIVIDPDSTHFVPIPGFLKITVRAIAINIDALDKLNAVTRRYFNAGAAVDAVGSDDTPETEEE